MGFDFSRLDAELAALGEVPANLADLARSYAGTPGSLADTDALLAPLGEPLDLKAFAAPLVVAPPARPRAPAAPPPKSEEIALPEPVMSGPSPGSGELALDGATPRSGSFALDNEPPPENTLDLGFEEDDSDADFDAEFAALSGPDAPLAAVTPPAPEPSAPVTAPEPQAALASLAPLSIDTEEDAEENAALALFDVQVTAPPAAAPGNAYDSNSDDWLVTNPPAAKSSDPDADFDALFADATSPSAISSIPAIEPEAEDNVNALLRDLGSPPVPKDLVPGGQLPISSAWEEGDATEVGDFDIDALAGPSPKRENPFASEEELPSSEFEIVMDDDAPGVTGKPVAKAKPPAPPPPTPEKRPSFLGRLFGPKKD